MTSNQKTPHHRPSVHPHINTNTSLHQSPARSELSQRLQSNPQLNLNQSLIQPDLNSMPNEIKERIVYWVDTLDHHPLHQSIHQSTTTISNQDDDDQFEDLDQHSSSSSASSSSSNKPSKSPLSSIKSLSLVDRTFYELCRPLIWESLDFEGGTISKLQSILSDIIPRHADCIRSIWWRVSYSELREFEDVFEDEAELTFQTQWDPVIRSDLLLQILKSCQRLINLDIDLGPDEILTDSSHPPTQDSVTQPLDFTNLASDLQPIHLPNTPAISDSGTMNKFIQPISRLTALTTLALSAPSERPPFSEAFLVQILGDLRQLQSFTCSRIDASAPKALAANETCLSPLGLHLASLPNLVALDLSLAECVDMNWTRIDWTSSLVALSLEECDRVSVDVLHKFTKQFASTLTELDLDQVPYHEDGSRESEIILKDLWAGKYVFELPKLTILTVSNMLPIHFLRAFKGCKALVELGLSEVPALRYEELEGLIKDNLWPSLKRLGISTQTGFLSPGELEALELYCHSKGIEMHLDEDSDDDEDSIDLAELQDEWEYEQGQDQDDDDDDVDLDDDDEIFD